MVIYIYIYGYIYIYIYISIYLLFTGPYWKNICPRSQKFPETVVPGLFMKAKDLILEAELSSVKLHYLDKGKRETKILLIFYNKVISSLIKSNFVLIFPFSI